MTEKEKDKRAEEQALFMTWLTSLTDEEWEMFRDHIAYFQNTLSGLPVAVAVMLDLQNTIEGLKHGEVIEARPDTRLKWERYMREAYGNMSVMMKKGDDKVH
jgi:hypothetical protein